MSASDNESYSRGLVSYSSRDYDSLMAEFKELIPTLTSTWTADAESDPGVVLLKLLASTADMLGVNLDWLANEIYAPTVSQRKNAEKVFGLIGYTLGFYTAAKTEITFTNNTEESMIIDFGFNGTNFSTVNAYTDITGESRTLTYNILPMTSSYGSTETRSIRDLLTTNLDIFSLADPVTLKPGESCTRVGIEGELRSYIISVADVKANDYRFTLPSQHIDTSALWMLAKANSTDDTFLATQWQQCETTAEFVDPEPRFAVTYDNYSNAQITVSNYLNQLQNYESNWLVVYWIDCSGTIGCVADNVLSNLLLAIDQNISDTTGDVTISNLANTVELPNTFTVTGLSPETAKEAYKNSRNFINTWNSLITLPDYIKFLNREPGVDCSTVIDCQKAVEINLAIYNDESLTDSQKSKMYITYKDFPEDDHQFGWEEALGLGFDPTDPEKFVFAANFKTYTAMCFAIHNDFNPSNYGVGKESKAQISNSTKFIRYKPPQLFIDGVISDIAPLQSLAVDIQFGYARIFTFYIIGKIYTKKPVSQSVGSAIISLVKEALALHFAPANRTFGVKPTMMEVVDTVIAADDRIRYFDGGSNTSDCIYWDACDIEYFNPISYAKYDPTLSLTDITIDSSCLVN